MKTKKVIKKAVEKNRYPKEIYVATFNDGEIDVALALKDVVDEFDAGEEIGVYQFVKVGVVTKKIEVS